MSDRQYKVLVNCSTLMEGGGLQVAAAFIVHALQDPDAEDWEYMIFTEDGCCVRMGILEKGKNKISLKDMCKGEYFVYLSNGEQRYMEKVKQ